ncbi:MAG: type II toxin-antitoxin system RelE/ParE family toxin [Nitrospirota bacterium]|nr:type II toxin-antitoxin system RelE/ParE family toxin [Nitrospirota bacterium]
MISVAFLPPAEEEMVAAAQYYEARSHGLGADFLDEVERNVEAISLHPRTAPVVKEGIRRRLLKRFPFGILYAVEPNVIVVLAVMHLRRRPGYWEERLKKH